MAATAEESAACCANFYEQDWVQDLLGDSFHPGGKALSARLIHSLGLPPGAQVLDAACGIGTTTRIMSNQFGLMATGVDLSRDNVNKATALAKGSANAINFVCGPVDSLPFADESMDAVICECAVSTFGNQADVLAEFNRILKPGGALAISDMAVERELPTEIATQIAPWTCLAEAHSVQGYQRLFLDAGFSIVGYADESFGLHEMVADLKRKLLAAGLGKALGAINGAELSISEARRLLGSAKQLIDEGTVQYCWMVLSKGPPTHCNPDAPMKLNSEVQGQATEESAEDCGCDDGSCC
jgi:SAM-dependent methyltransferase